MSAGTRQPGAHHWQRSANRGRITASGIDRALQWESGSVAHQISITMQQLAHLQDLPGTCFVQTECNGEGLEKLPLRIGHVTIAMDQLAGQGEGCFLMPWRENGSSSSDQALPGLLTEALQQARDQQAERIGLHGAT